MKRNLVALLAVAALAFLATAVTSSRRATTSTRDRKHSAAPSMRRR